MEVVKGVSSFLDDYWARNQVFRTMQFSSAMLSGLVEQRGHTVTSKKLMEFSMSVSNMRVMLRLLDDIPALMHTILTYSRAKASLSEVVAVLCGQLYYPLEHVAWAADQGFIPVHSTTAWTIAIILWAVPLVITIIQQLNKLICTNVTICSQKLKSSEPRQWSVCSVQKLRAERVKTLLCLVQATCDLALAVFWLPEGWLWGRRLSASCWGLLGTISSLLGLYQMIKSKQTLEEANKNS